MKPGSIIHWNSLFLIASTSYAYSLASHSNFLRAVAPFTRKELTRLNLSEDDAPDDDGRELAEKFYEQMRKRQEQTSSNNNSSRDDETYEVVSRNRSGARRKFTGRRGERDSTGTPSAGLFSSQSGSIYAIDTGKRSLLASSCRTLISSIFNLILMFETRFDFFICQVFNSTTLI